MKIWIVNNGGWIEAFDSEAKAWDYIFSTFLLNNDSPLTVEDLEDIRDGVLHHGFDVSIFSTTLK